MLAQVIGPMVEAAELPEDTKAQVKALVSMAQDDAREKSERISALKSAIHLIARVKAEEGKRSTEEGQPEDEGQPEKG